MLAAATVVVAAAVVVAATAAVPVATAAAAAAQDDDQQNDPQTAVATKAVIPTTHVSFTSLTLRNPWFRDSVLFYGYPLS